MCIPDSGTVHQQPNHAAATAIATAVLDAQLQSAEQQNQELQSQLHHKAMRVANAEAAQKSAESERDAMVQENARLEELVSRHQQVQSFSHLGPKQVSHDFSLQCMSPSTEAVVDRHMAHLCQHNRPRTLFQCLLVFVCINRKSVFSVSLMWLPDRLRLHCNAHLCFCLATF